MGDKDSYNENALYKVSLRSSSDRRLAAQLDVLSSAGTRAGFKTTPDPQISYQIPQKPSKCSRPSVRPRRCDTFFTARITPGMKLDRSMLS